MLPSKLRNPTRSPPPKKVKGNSAWFPRAIGGRLHSANTACKVTACSPSLSCISAFLTSVDKDNEFYFTLCISKECLDFKIDFLLTNSCVFPTNRESALGKCTKSQSHRLQCSYCLRVGPGPRPCRCHFKKIGGTRRKFDRFFCSCCLFSFQI